jgi:hypothetical protein
VSIVADSNNDYHWPFPVALQWKSSFVFAMWHAFSVLFRGKLPWGCATGATPGWYVVPIQGTGMFCAFSAENQRGDRKAQTQRPSYTKQPTLKKICDICG